MAEASMTIAEIEAKYPNQWVLVDKLKKGRDGLPIGGIVLTHSPEREVVYQSPATLPIPRDVALFHIVAEV